MAERILDTYKSRRNRVRLVQTDVGRLVVKFFADEVSFQTELRIYRQLQAADLPCAKVITAEDRTLTLSELPGRNLVDCLERQERDGKPVWAVWETLVDWLIAFWRQTGLVMTDVNLRNFLYDEETGVLCGVDFEECDTGDLVCCAARVAAYIRTYRPEHTPLKQEIARYVLNLFAQRCGLEVDVLLRESERQEATLLERRNK